MIIPKLLRNVNSELPCAAKLVYERRLCVNKSIHGINAREKAIRLYSQHILQTMILLTQRRLPVLDLDCGEHERINKLSSYGQLSSFILISFVDSISTFVYSRKENIDHNIHVVLFEKWNKIEVEAK